MLPDIDHPNRQYQVSGLGSATGGGVLTRSYEDLHPRHDAYETVWNGTMAAQQQKAEQRQPTIWHRQALSPEAILDFIGDGVVTMQDLLGAFDATPGRMYDAILKLRIKGLVRAESKPNPDLDAKGRAKWCFHISRIDDRSVEAA